MLTDIIAANNLRSFGYELRIPTFKRSCKSKQFVLTTKFNFSFFVGVIRFRLLKSGDLEINQYQIYLMHA